MKGEWIRREGIGWVPQKVARILNCGPGSSGGGYGQALVELRRRRGIETAQVGPLTDEETVVRVREAVSDLAIYATRGILRPPILGVSTLSTLNVHMGLLPCYRGTNVVEWSRLTGDTSGCSIYLRDPEVDTGDILARRVLDTGEVSSVAGLRKRVDEAQLKLLGEVVESVVRTGRLPEARPQEAGEGVQYFRMHPISGKGSSVA